MDLSLLLRNLQINDATETNNSTSIFQGSKDLVDKNIIDLLRNLLWKIDRQCKEPCNGLYEATCILREDCAFSGQTWIELSSAVLKFHSQTLAIRPLTQQRDVLNAIWSIVYICSKRYALILLDSIEDRVKSVADGSLFQEEIVKLKSYVKMDDPCAILAMSNRGRMHLNEFSEAENDEKGVAGILNHWDEVRHLIWNVISRLWLHDDSWDNLTMGEHLAKLQHKISLMQAPLGCRGLSLTRARAPLAPVSAQPPNDETSRPSLRQSLRLNRRRRLRQHRVPIKDAQGRGFPEMTRSTRPGSSLHHTTWSSRRMLLRTRSAKASS